ncbi:MAG: DEAD/DEAH box helicase [Clostridia bacterium]|nr:DEAD/DEAH box helicase [Clostridia bacterium]
MTLTVGQTISMATVKQALQEHEFSVHGDIIDVHLPNNTEIVRIMFFDDTIEDLRLIDANTRAFIKKLPMVNLGTDLSFSLALDILKQVCPDRDWSRVSAPTAILPSYNSAVSLLADELATVKNQTVLLFVGNTKTAENYLRNKKIDFIITKSTAIPNCINIIPSTFPLSCQIDDLLIYSLTDTNPGKTLDAGTGALLTKTKKEFIMPLVGECVVHSLHGIGRFMGIKKLDLLGDGNFADYLTLQYDGGTMVYLATDKTDVLSNYVGEPTRLHKIGGQDFANAKQRVRRRLQELSFKLSDLYRQRAGIKRPPYEILADNNAAFAASFPYNLTKDQDKVMQDIYADLSSPRLMDRLVCGDVGYGKTEIAFRTAFNAVMNGHQVVLLCPTTILSMQHYQNAVARFQPFGIKVAVYNRFITAKQQAQTLADLQDGKIDIIIGTHKLLSLTNTNFHHLGLLILDEEQRFGVEAKEKIKKLTPNVDVLTLSATPIPRTLNMSLMGLRDISVITTPPKDRLPVITRVAEFSWELLWDAIDQELNRNGQVIVLYNTVRDMEKFASKIAARYPNKVGYVHGQMATSQIERTITAVYEHEIDIIVASTILENGIDLTTANTLFVVGADKLGLAQMHQLRGRVGRSTTQAYAYLTYARAEYTTDKALERINAIKNFYSTGAGFNIAMRDLEIRGSGEVLGANQSGHIEEIGIEAFAQILNEIAAENRHRQQTMLQPDIIDE